MQVLIDINVAFDVLTSEKALFFHMKSGYFWILDSEYSFIGKTDEEKSLVCMTEGVPSDAMESSEIRRAYAYRIRSNS